MHAVQRDYLSAPRLLLVTLDQWLAVLAVIATLVTGWWGRPRGKGPE